MRTMIRIFQCQKFIDQGISLPGRTSDDFPLLLPYMPWLPVWKQRYPSGSCICSQKQDCQAFPETVLPPSRPYRFDGTALIQYSLPPNGLNLKSKILEIVYGLPSRRCFFLKIQGYDQRRAEILGFDCLFTKPFYETFIIDFFMCRMLVDNIKIYPQTVQASKYQKSVRSADDGFGIQEQEVSPQIIPAAVAFAVSLLPVTYLPALRQAVFHVYFYRLLFLRKSFSSAFVKGSFV